MKKEKTESSPWQSKGSAERALKEQKEGESLQRLPSTLRLSPQKHLKI